MSAAANVPLPIADLPMNGIVYRAWIGDYHYTGSTFKTLHARARDHRNHANLTGGFKFHKHVLKNGGWDAVRWIALESGISDKETLVRREASFINKEDSYCLNCYDPVAKPPVPVVYKGRSEEKKVYDQAYYETRKEEIKQRRRERYAADKKDPVKMARHREVCNKAAIRYKAKKKAGLTPSGGAGE